MTTTARTGPRVRAPELTGRSWLNTGGRPLALRDLRGKIVLLDFWAFCCINCLHVIDELRQLEDEYSDVLVTVGVHSPKFEHEADQEALAAAVERYDVRHPVLDDPELTTWQAYTARAWPTLAVIDPTGYVVATMSGEGHAEAIGRLVEELIARHEADGTLHRGDGPYVPPPPPETALRFPGKVAAVPGGTLLVSDTRHHSVVELAADGETVLRRIGTGERGRRDGGADQAQFSEPQGLALLPPDVAERAGYDVVVADTVNHLLRGLTLTSGEVRTIAGSGRQWRSPDQPAAPLEQDLSSPWDVVWWQDRLVIAMAGIHQLWSFDPPSGVLGPYAGTTVEGLRDGPLTEAWLAQPSGLAADGDRLWIADSETSSLRYVEAGRLHTAVGQGLFDFGHRDGTAADARFQHPLGLAVLPDRTIAVLDTYNDAVRRYDPATGEVSTLATDVREPSAGVVVDGELIVVESAAHRLTRPLSPGASRQILGRAQQTHRPASDLAAGPVTLEVVFAPANGQKLDERYGPATLLTVSASPPGLLVEGAGRSTELRRVLQISPEIPEGVLHVTAQAASCDVDVAHPACHLTRQDWGVPVRILDGGPSRLGLVLRGMDAEAE